jgi:hypothetical protein
MVFFMQEVLEKMQMSMELKGFAKSTKKTYSAHIKGIFFGNCGKDT